MSIITKIIPTGQVRIDGQTCKVTTKKLRNFTNGMVSKGFDHESYRQCSTEEITKYLQAIKGILPKKASKIKVPLDKTHTYQFLQAHGAVQIYDKTANKEVMALVKHAKEFVK